MFENLILISRGVHCFAVNETVEKKVLNIIFPHHGICVIGGKFEVD